MAVIALGVFVGGMLLLARTFGPTRTVAQILYDAEQAPRAQETDSK